MARSPVTARLSADSIAGPATRALAAAIVAVMLLGVCWAVEVFDYTSDGRLSRTYGLRAHHISGIWHIFTAPFLHASLDHIMANSLPLLILGFLSALHGVSRFLAVSAIIIVASGLGVYFLSAPGVVTVGASGLIFGYFGYLLVRGFFERSLIDIAVGFAVAVFYGTMIFGALPGQAGISWQAHLFGLIGGVLAARVTRRR